MSWFTETFTEFDVAWLLLSSFVATIAGFLSSLMTYRFVTRRKILDKLVMEEEREKKERIRQDVVRWANPILASVKELRSRLDNILYSAGYLALSKNYESNVNSNWSISYEYFMNSTLYVFGQYFAWTRMFQEKINFELFESQKDKDDFLMAIRNTSKALGSFPPSYSCSGKDTQLFGLQQRAIGEKFISSEPEQCLKYADFLQELENEWFCLIIEPLKSLLENVNPESDCRWKRLEATRQALIDLEFQCNKVLVLPDEP